MARAETAGARARPLRTADLVVLLWRLLASAQLAVALLGLLALAGLVAVLLPQVPAAIRGSAPAVDVWLAGQEGKFGPFTEPVYRLGLFTVVTSWWFLTALGLLAVSVCVYAADRCAAVWRNVTRPREAVPDSFFERAANHAVFAGAPAKAVEAALARRRFEVRRTVEGETTYLFADRFAWAQLGSLVTHLAVVLFLAGGLISHFGGYTNALLIAEGTASPVFPVSDPDQMQVEVVDAVGAFDESGSALDYRSELVIYRGGEEVARGVATVNDPLTYDGYRFHQAGYLGEGAALRVRDAATGNALYREVLPLQDLVPAPVVTVRDASGAVLLDDAIVPTDFIEGAQGTLLSVPGSAREFWVGVSEREEGAWELIVYDRDDPDARFVIPAGATREAVGLSWTFHDVDGLPSTLESGVPGDSARSLVMLAQDEAGAPYLTLLGPVDGRALTLYAERPVRIDGREYVFEGRREFAGIEVRRDPGVNFIWAAAGLLLAGLLVTFYVPRLRLWVRVRPDETALAAPAERAGVFQSEVTRLARELGLEKRGNDG
jgi:cytochrome c biogenesis protein ResB